MRIVYQNNVFLKGIVGDGVKFGRAKNGKDYCTFSLMVAADASDLKEDDMAGAEYIHIIIFNNKKKKLVDFLRSMNFRRGLYVDIIGKLHMNKKEYKGIDLMQMNVIVKEINIMTTKPIKLIGEDGEQGEQKES